MLNSPVWRGAPTLAFCLGLLCGGVVAAMVFLVAGSLLRAPLPGWARVGVIAVAYAVIVLREYGVIRLRLPENRRLVPESVFRLGRLLGPFQFGLEMGTGARTFLPSGLPYVGAIAVAFLAGPLAAVAIGVGFGLGRSMMTVSNLRYDDEGGWNHEWLAYGAVTAKALLASFTLTLATVVLLTAWH